MFSLRHSAISRTTAITLVSTAAVLVMSGTAHSQTAFGKGAVPTGSGWFFGISEASRVINENTPYEISVRETGGTVENARRLTGGDIDLAFVEALVGYELYNGLGRFEDHQNEDARLMYWIAPSTMHWAVGADTDIETVEDLEGRQFNPSTIGGGGEYITTLVFDVLGVEPDYQRMHISDAADGVVDGRLDGFSYNGIPPIPAFTEVHSSRTLRLLSLTDEQVEKVTEELPFLTATTVPEGTYRDMAAAQTISIYMGISANRTLSDEVVYEMTKAYWENHEEVSGSFAPAEGVTPEDTVENATFPLHAGAIQYYQEIGINIPEDVIPPEAQ